MPRFYFHLHNSIEAIDEEGVELPHMTAAKNEAISGAREIMAEEIKKGCIHLSHWIEVANEDGQQVLAVRFSDCVEVRP